jgi:hypothetical protein
MDRQCIVAPDGTLLPVSQASRLTALEVVNHVGNALLKPYDGRNIKHLGKTKLEAAADEIASQAQEGSIVALDTLLDRAVGKAVQQVNTVNVTATLKEFLDEIEQKETPVAVRSEAIDTATDPDIDPIG